MPEEVDSNGGEVSDAMSENEHEYDDNDKDDDKMTESTIKQEVGPDGEVKKKYDPKDPLRPRRKKARRACFACQRAHLTCGMPMNPDHDQANMSFRSHCSPLRPFCVPHDDAMSLTRASELSAHGRD